MIGPARTIGTSKMIVADRKSNVRVPIPCPDVRVFPGDGCAGGHGHAGVRWIGFDLHTLEIETMPTLPLVRPMRRADCPAVAEMIEALASHHGGRVKASPASLAHWCCGPHALARIRVACVGDAIAGFAQTYDWPNLQSGRLVRRLELLFVSQAFRRAGVGRALVVRLAHEALADGCAGLTVGAAASNADANAFYAGLGFTERRLAAQVRNYALGGPALRALAGQAG